MLKTIIKNDIEYERIDYLPRWAYTDEEWLDLKLSADLYIGDEMYKKIEKPDTSFDDLVRKLLLD